MGDLGYVREVKLKGHADEFGWGMRREANDDPRLWALAIESVMICHIIIRTHAL